ncbi:hypothetical protein CsSME_00013524 [Camellia sinensis var. sinensis]
MDSVDGNVLCCASDFVFLEKMDSTTAWFLVAQLIYTSTNSSIYLLLFQFIGTTLGVVHLTFFAFAHLMHTVANIYVVEVLFGGLMQIMVYLTGDDLYICILVSILFGGFIFGMMVRSLLASFRF